MDNNEETNSKNVCIVVGEKVTNKSKGEKRKFKCNCGDNNWIVDRISCYDKAGDSYNYKEWLTCGKCWKSITNERHICYEELERIKKEWEDIRKKREYQDWKSEQKSSSNRKDQSGVKGRFFKETAYEILKRMNFKCPLCNNEITLIQDVVNKTRNFTSFEDYIFCKKCKYWTNIGEDRNRKRVWPENPEHEWTSNQDMESLLLFYSNKKEQAGTDGLFFKEMACFDLDDFSKNNAYVVLSVTPEMSKKEILTKYRALQKKYHPDRFHQCPKEQFEEAGSISKLINWAKNEVL